MLSLYNSSIIRVGRDPEIAGELSDPDVMAVVMTDFFSGPALAFARSLTANPDYNIPGGPQITLATVIETSDHVGRGAFEADYGRFGTFFRKLCGRPYEDRSRIEPAIGNASTNLSRPLHVDGAGLIGLANPGSVAVQFPTRMLDGTFRDHSVFIPADPAAAENASVSLPEGAIVIGKGMFHPDSRKGALKGFIHRRPDSTERARIVMHFKA